MDDRHNMPTACAALLLTLFCTAAIGRELTVEVTDERGHPVVDAVVTVRGAGPLAEPAAAGQSAVMRQFGKAFDPYVLAVSTGTVVTFPNDDPFLHHVYSFASAKSFDLKLYDRDKTPDVLFDKPGMIAIGCNIHDTMRGYIVVTDDPWFAVTGADGRAHFDDLAEGAGPVEVWHYWQAGENAVQELAATGAATLGIVMKLKPQPPAALQPFEAGDY